MFLTKEEDMKFYRDRYPTEYFYMRCSCYRFRVFFFKISPKKYTHLFTFILLLEITLLLLLVTTERHFRILYNFSNPKFRKRQGEWAIKNNQVTVLPTVQVGRGPNIPKWTTLGWFTIWWEDECLLRQWKSYLNLKIAPQIVPRWLQIMNGIFTPLF